MDAARRHTVLVACLLCVGVLLLQAAWLAGLGFNSPVVPSPESGQTTALVLARQRRGPPTHVVYVRPAEALIAHALAAGLFVVPGAYLACGALRRRLKR